MRPNDRYIFSSKKLVKRRNRIVQSRMAAHIVNDSPFTDWKRRPQPCVVHTKLQQKIRIVIKVKWKVKIIALFSFKVNKGGL